MNEQPVNDNAPLLGDLVAFQAPIPADPCWGVEISSRYDDPAEIALMRQVLAELPSWARRAIKSIWCDSKCGSSFILELWPDADRLEVATPLAELLNELLLKWNNGHNGVSVGDTVSINPDWAFDHGPSCAMLSLQPRDTRAINDDDPCWDIPF